MFSTLGLFKKTRCPAIQNCERTNCPFSHSQSTPAEPPALNIPIHTPEPQPQPRKERKEQPKPTPSSSSLQNLRVPSKRAASELQTGGGIAAIEPPRKISKVGPAQNFGAVPKPAQTPVSPEILDRRTTIRDNTRYATHLPARSARVENPTRSIPSSNSRPTGI